jgi:histidyl-tRNA synthetase
MTALGFQRLPGFRDFPPEELALRTHIFDAWRRISRRYGFQEYDGPPLEPLELYVEKSGAEIVEQLYAFTDKGNRQVALRPEMTPSLARILAERSRALPKPIRWFSIPQLFRYERQQRGRLREHFQWNVDVVGEEGVLADAEVLAVAVDGLSELGLGPSDFRARVSDRVLLAALLEAAGVPADRTPHAFATVDKIEREGRARSFERLEREAGLGRREAERVLELFETPTLEAARALYGERERVAERAERLEVYLDALGAMGLGEFLQVDLSIVRGLAYYTGIVFELFDRQGELRAICGGGRYDNLLELVGGEALPAVGFGMGDVVLCELLQGRGLLPPGRTSLDYFIVTVRASQRPVALALAHRLRAAGKGVAYALREQPLKKQFSAAGTAGARAVIVLGPDEVARGVARVRDMGTGSEREVTIAELEAAGARDGG